MFLILVTRVAAILIMWPKVATTIPLTMERLFSTTYTEHKAMLPPWTQLWLWSTQMKISQICGIHRTLLLPICRFQLQHRISNPLLSWYAIRNHTYNNGLYNATGLRMNTCILRYNRWSEFPAGYPGLAPWTTLFNLTTTNYNFYGLYGTSNFNPLNI